MRKKIYIDQMHRKVEVSTSPKRIISLVPSQTELLFDLGLENEVVGITKFCIYPDSWYKTKARVGGTKNIDFEKIKELNPDLIIGNKEENEEASIKELINHYPVWMSDIHNLDDALEMINSIGEIVGKEEKALSISSQISKNFLEFQPQSKNNLSVLYLIWKNPFIGIGSETFIHQMLLKCGLKNVLENHNNKRYPELSVTDIINSNPDLIFLSSEPYPFKKKHINELQNICPQAKIVLVDGELFSWYGSRLLYSSEYFSQLIHKL